MNKLLLISLIVIVLVLLPANNKEGAVERGLRIVADKYGKDIARKVEQIFRKETAHFTSGGFKKTNSPGMEIHSPNFPWGWTSFTDIWKLNPSIAPVGQVTMKENQTLKTKTFLKFATPGAAMETLALYLQKYRPGRWYSLLPDQQSKYEFELAQIKPRIVDALT